MYLFYENSGVIINIDNFERIEVVEDDNKGFYVAGINKVASFDYDLTIGKYATYVDCQTRLTATGDKTTADVAFSVITNGLREGIKVINMIEKRS